MLKTLQKRVRTTGDKVNAERIIKMETKGSILRWSRYAQRHERKTLPLVWILRINLFPVNKSRKQNSGR